MGVRPGGATRQTAAWALIVLLGAISTMALVFLLDAMPQPRDTISLPWWALAGAFLLAEIWVVHLHFRSEAGTFSLYEVPLVFGLIFSTPSAVWIAVVVGAGVGLRVMRGQPTIKVAFNMANLSLHVVVAALVLDLFAVTDPLAPSAWLLLGTATTMGGVLNVVLLALVITVTEGTFNRPQLVTMVAMGAVISMANTALAIVAATLIEDQPWGLVPLGVTLVVLLAAYRAYVAERTQRERVEFLYSSTKALRENPETTSAAAALLDEATSMFRAARGELYVFSRPEEPAGVSHFRYEGGTTLANVLENDAAAIELASVSAVPVLATSESKPPWMSALGPGVRDAMVGALHGSRRDVAVLVVANRLGNVTSFTNADLRLFETLVQHAAVALENDQLEQALGEMRRLEQDLAHQANHDSLTGLANRQLFSDRLAEHLDAETDVSVLYVDLDDFKVVNDTLGHDAGDRVLIEVARRVGQIIRPDDTAARLGGDEFAVILPESHDPQLVARRIIQSLHDPFLIGDHDVQIGASIGVASGQGSSTEASALLNDADVAMYAAKSEGKGSVVAFQSAMREHVGRQRRLRTQLRRAIDLDEFRVAYQPIVELTTGRMVGAEALVRWHGSEGVQMPDAFIGEAEKAGLIVPIDRKVLASVVSDIDGLVTPGGAEPFVSVNLSARNFQQEDLVDHFASTLIGGGVAASRIVVEITETALLRDPDRTVELLTELRQLGIRIALDDFGTGYSSLSYLRRLPVDILKIAQPFVADVAGDDSFVRAMADLARNLGLVIVAEGIEEPQQLEVLKSLGCDLGQGYLFAAPMRHPELVDYMAADTSDDLAGR